MTPVRYGIQLTVSSEGTRLRRIGESPVGASHFQGLHMSDQPAMPVEQPPFQIGLGVGQVAISAFHDGDVHGLMFKDVGEVHEVGETISDTDEPMHVPANGEVYIACLNREAAFVLQEMVNRVVNAFRNGTENEHSENV